MKKRLMFTLLGILLMLVGILLMLVPIQVNAENNDTEVETEVETEVDWKTAISSKIQNKILDKMFVEDTESEYKTMYVTTNLNMRDFPNTEASEVIKVLRVNNEVTVVAEYHGWSRIVEKDETTQEDVFYYVWNEYLSENKLKTSGNYVYSGNEEYLGNFLLTAYCNCSRCCGKWAGGPTASGNMPSVGRTVAMGGVPFGTKLLINGHVYTVEDRGTPYGHVDIFFNSHSEADQFGKKYAEVYKVN